MNSVEYYNNFTQRLIDDYINGNPRTESAIINLGSFIPQNAKKILDIGCGIGWSSNEFAKKYENCSVMGIDLSPDLIQTAVKLYSRINLTFLTMDATEILPEGKFDAIIMIDVYEHIPINARTEFNRKLGSLLTESGRLILSCPSRFHQKWLKDNKPDGLQPTDEDIDIKIITQLAIDVFGELTHFSYHKIWHNYDYLYSVIERNIEYNSKNYFSNTSKIVLEPTRSRIERVHNELGIIMPVKKRKTVILSKLQRKTKSTMKIILNRFISWK